MTSQLAAVVPPEDETDAQVRREDQDNINRFARLNARLGQLRQRSNTLQADLDALDDASTELMMMDNTNNNKVLLLAGEAFLETPEDEATEYCEGLVETLQAKKEAHEAEIKDILQQQEELKRVLYARFGNAIHLEDDR